MDNIALFILLTYLQTHFKSNNFIKGAAQLLNVLLEIINNFPAFRYV